MKRKTRSAGDLLNEFFSRAPRPSREQLDLSRRNILERLGSQPAPMRDDSAPVPIVYRSRWRFRFAVAGAALAIALAGTAVILRTGHRGSIPLAVAEASDGSRFRFGDMVRSNGNEGMLLRLTDGSRIEMRSQSELALEPADDGVRIRLNSGGVVVTAAKPPRGHLYVQTKDMTVSVVGTVSVVNDEATGSRVAGLRGEAQRQPAPPASLAGFQPVEQVELKIVRVRQ
jgi:ferric-dicitrate binding protein FerR (iron transport regulator)